MTTIIGSHPAVSLTTHASLTAVGEGTDDSLGGLSNPARAPTTQPVAGMSILLRGITATSSVFDLVGGDGGFSEAGCGRLQLLAGRSSGSAIASASSPNQV